jgi:hypothetical protein
MPSKSTINPSCCRTFPSLTYSPRQEANCGTGFTTALQDSIYPYSTSTGGTCACRGGSTCKLPNLCKQTTSSILERFCMLCKVSFSPIPALHKHAFQDQPPNTSQGVCDQRTATSTPTLFPIWSSPSVTSSTGYDAATTTTTSDGSSFSSHRCVCVSSYGCRIPNSCVGFTSTAGGRCYRCLASSRWCFVSSAAFL